MVFRSLTKDQIRNIVALELARVNDQLVEQAVTLEIADEVKDFLADEGYDAEYGARPLRRIIQDKLEDQLSEAMLSGTVKPGSKVRVTLGENKELAFDVELAVTIAPPPPTVTEATEELVN
jgi:ATP-dependent Clp protease ATP-binding subunit ClpA